MTSTRPFFIALASISAVAILALQPTAATARDRVDWSISIGTPSYPPTYYAPPRAYYPPPVVYQAPPPVVYAPRTVYPMVPPGVVYQGGYVYDYGYRQPPRHGHRHHRHGHHGGHR